jgi:hypothetical protein
MIKALFVSLGIFLISFNPPLNVPKNSSKGVILLTFNGYNPKTCLFNQYDHLSPSDLYYPNTTTIQEKVSKYFSDFDVTITTDDSLFYSYPKDHRVRVVITSDSLPQYNDKGNFINYAGGLSYYNALHRNDTTPSLVSSLSLGNDAKDISEAICHEVGHQLGLQHQSKWFAFFKLREYNPGNEERAPIMGNSYHSKRAVWYKGFNSYLQWQDDKKIISNTFQLKVH